jgi:hypothetical protein
MIEIQVYGEPLDLKANPDLKVTLNFGTPTDAQVNLATYSTALLLPKTANNDRILSTDGEFNWEIPKPAILLINSEAIRINIYLQSEEPDSYQCLINYSDVDPFAALNGSARDYAEKLDGYGRLGELKFTPTDLFSLVNQFSTESFNAETFPYLTIVGADEPLTALLTTQSIVADVGNLGRPDVVTVFDLVFMTHVASLISYAMTSAGYRLAIPSDGGSTFPVTVNAATTELQDENKYYNLADWRGTNVTEAMQLYRSLFITGGELKTSDKQIALQSVNYTTAFPVSYTAPVITSGFTRSLRWGVNIDNNTGGEIGLFTLDGTSYEITTNPWNVLVATATTEGTFTVTIDVPTALRTWVSANPNRSIAGIAYDEVLGTYAEQFYDKVTLPEAIVFTFERKLKIADVIGFVFQLKTNTIDLTGFSALATRSVNYVPNGKLYQGGYIPYGAMCPGISMKDLVGEVCLRFNARFRIDPVNKTWGIYKFNEDYLRSPFESIPYPTYHDFTGKFIKTEGYRRLFTESGWAQEAKFGWVADEQSPVNVDTELRIYRPAFQIGKTSDYVYRSKFSLTPFSTYLRQGIDNRLATVHPYIPCRTDAPKSWGISIDSTNKTTVTMKEGDLAFSYTGYVCYKAKSDQPLGADVTNPDLFEVVDFFAEVETKAVEPRIGLMRFDNLRWTAVSGQTATGIDPTTTFHDITYLHTDLDDVVTTKQGFTFTDSDWSVTGGYLRSSLQGYEVWTAQFQLSNADYLDLVNYPTRLVWIGDEAAWFFPILVENYDPTTSLCQMQLMRVVKPVE